MSGSASRQYVSSSSSSAAGPPSINYYSCSIIYLISLSLVLSHTHIWTEYDALKRTRACATFINNATTWENKHTQRIYIELQSQRSFDKLADKSSQTSWKNKQKNTIRWPSETSVQSEYVFRRRFIEVIAILILIPLFSLSLQFFKWVDLWHLSFLDPGNKR